MTPYEKRICRTCKYGGKPEYHKPCVMYRDDCHLYEKKEEHNKMSKRDKLIAGSDVIFVESPPYGFDLKGWLSSFNTDSATECFTAVQELKEKLNGQMD